MVNSTASQLPTGVQFEKQLGQLSTWVRVMRQAGLPIEEALQRPIDDPEMRKRLVIFWNSGGFQPSTSQKRVRETMGRNMFGIEEAIQYLGVNPSREHLAVLAKIPWSEKVLRSCKDTHILVAIFPLSILDIRSKASSDSFYDQSWYNEEPFAKDRGEAEWQLVRKTPVPDSISKTLDEQQRILGKDDEMPKARVMVYTTIGHFLATGKRLFEKFYVRCSDVDSRGCRVCVGVFGSRGLVVDSYWGDARYDGLGLASARKSRVLIP